MAISILDGNVTDQNGIPVAGAQVYVFDREGNMPALLDAQDQVTTNPYVTGEDGYFGVRVPEGYYTLQYYWGERLRRIDAWQRAGNPADEVTVLYDRMRAENAADIANDKAAQAAADRATVANDKELAATYATAAAAQGNRVFTDQAAARAALNDDDRYWYSDGTSLQLFERTNATTSTAIAPNTRIPTVEGLRADKAGGSFGDMFRKASDLDGAGFGWTGRDDLSDQLVSAIDLSLDAGAPGSVQFTASTATPTGAYTGISGEKLRITQDGFTWKGFTTPFKVLPGRSYLATFKADALDANGGIGIGFDPVAPTPDSAAVRALASGFFGMQWRALSAIRTLYDHTGGTVPAGPTINNTAGGLTADEFSRSLGEEFSLLVEISSDGATATIYYLDGDGNFIEGAERAVTTITGVPASSYLWLGMHAGSTAGNDDVTIGPVKAYAPSADLPRALYANASAVITGMGTQDNPVLEPDEISRFVALDKSRRRFHVKLKAGTYNRPLVLPDASAFDELTIDGPVGEKVIIDPSDLLDRSGWTKIADYANLYMRDAAFGYNGLTSTNSSVVEVPGEDTLDLSQTVGFRGLTHTYPWFIYTRLPVDLTNPFSGTTFTLADMDAVPGTYVAFATGPMAGKIVIHARDSLNPNALTFRRPMSNYGVAVLAKGKNRWNMPRVRISGLEVRNSYIAGFQFQRCIVDIQNCNARGVATGAGFQFDESTGRGDALMAEGTGSDHFNMNGTFKGIPDDLHPRMVLTSCSGLGSPVPVARDTGQINQGFSGGDNVSNHDHQDITLVDFYGIGSAKVGVGAGGDLSMLGCTIEGARGAAVQIYESNDNETHARLNSNSFRYCGRGVELFASSARNAQGTMDVQSCVFDSNETESVYAEGDTATITLHGQQAVYGATPSNGHKRTGAGAVIDHRAASVMP